MARSSAVVGRAACCVHSDSRFLVGVPAQTNQSIHSELVSDLPGKDKNRLTCTSTTAHPKSLHVRNTHSSCLHDIQQRKSALYMPKGLVGTSFILIL